MKKPGLLILIIICLIIFFTTLTAGILLTARVIGTDNLFDPGKLSDRFAQLADRFGHFNLAPGFGRTFNLDEVKDLDLTDIETVEIISVSEELQVTAGEKAYARLSGSYRSFGSELVWVAEQFGSTLKIHIRYPRIGIVSNKLNLDVQIPSSFDGMVKITTVSASCSLPDLVDYAWKSLDIHSVSGDIHVAQGDIDQISLVSVSGKIRIDQANGRLTGRTTSGDLEITYKTFHLSTLSSVSGSVMVDLPADADGQFEFTSVSGDFQNDGMPLSLENQQNRKSSGTFGQGGELIKVQTTSGDLVMKSH